MKSVRIVALAQDELRQAGDWYNRQGGGIGSTFVDAVDALLTAIRENPRRFPVIHADIRRAMVRRFPYGVFFLDKPDEIRVIGIVHLHRHPDTWRRRR